MSIIEEITRAYEAERHAPPLITKFGDVPGTFDEVTPQFLTAVLCRDHPAAEVLSFTQGEKDNGSSNRRRFFLTYNDAGAQAGLTKTVFCKGAESLLSRIMLGSAGTSLGEVDFFNKVRSRLDIEAPEAIYAAFNPESYAYIVILKDIAGRVEFCDERTPVTRARAESMVDLLARFHSTFFQSQELGTETIPYRTWPKFWRDMIPEPEVWIKATTNAINLSEHVMPPRLFKRRHDIWPATEASVERHNSLPRTLIHCDVHIKNWYIAGGNKMGLADWQIMTTGHWSRDLIYALGTALEIEDRRAWLDDLLKRYVYKMREYGVPDITYDEALLNVRQQAFSALAFWTITLVPAPGMPPMQPERTTYKFIERLSAVIDDLDSFGSFS